MDGMGSEQKSCDPAFRNVVTLRYNLYLKALNS